jgi:putative ABC transport system permease protein
MRQLYQSKEESRYFNITHDFGGSNLIRLFNPQSVESVVSPTFASLNYIKPITKEQLYSSSKITGLPLFFKNRTTSTGQIENLLYFDSSLFMRTYPNSYIKIKELVYAVIGTGVMPNYAYPIFSNSSVVVNSSKDAAVFVNKAGLERFKDNFRDSDIQENYLVIKKNNDYSIQEAEKILSQEASKVMSWPGNIASVKRVDDFNDAINLSSIRTYSLKKINTSIENFTWIFISIVFILCAFIVSMIVKRKIDSSLKNLAILEAIGYSRGSIAISFTSISIIVGLVPCILGYIIGYSLQFAIQNVFKTY